MRQTIDNLEDRIAAADSLEELTSIGLVVSDLFKRLTPTNEREFLPQLCQLEEQIAERKKEIFISEFGEDFMNSDDKGSIKEYKED